MDMNDSFTNKTFLKTFKFLYDKMYIARFKNSDRAKEIQSDIFKLFNYIESYFSLQSINNLNCSKNIKTVHGSYSIKENSPKVLFLYLCMFFKFIKERKQNITVLTKLTSNKNKLLFTTILEFGNKYNCSKKYVDHKKTTFLCGISRFISIYGYKIKILQENNLINVDKFLKLDSSYDLIKLISTTFNHTIKHTSEFIDTINLDLTNELQSHFNKIIFNSIFNELLTNKNISYTFKTVVRKTDNFIQTIDDLRYSQKISTFLAFYIY